MRQTWMLTALLLAIVSAAGTAQTPVAAPVEFDVVSIKRNLGNEPFGGTRTLPDGSFTMTNQPMSSVIRAASPVPVRDVVGLPEWARIERYDIVAKMPPGAPLERRNDMWRAMFADRMKLVAHVEEQERDTFALVVARDDGRLGPQLTPSTLECGAGARNSQPSQPVPSGPPSSADAARRCGVSLRVGEMVSGGITMDQLVQSMGGAAGRLVNNRTGLQGFFALTLTFSRPRTTNTPDSVPLDAPPDIFTALREQLGLALVPEKSMVPVLVIDRIERPSEN